MKIPRLRCLFVAIVFCCVSLTSGAALDGKPFWHFDSGQVRPLALSPDGSRLFVVNTPDNHLEIFDVSAAGLDFVGSVPVGLEPVAVAARSNSEVWVVNHLSDSISIIEVSAGSAKVSRTLLVGDEPRDIVFAGTPISGVYPRAFITTAHRGQAYPDIGGDKYGDFFTPSVGRADVWVFDANNLGASLGGAAETIVTLFGDTPRALAVTPNGASVYAAVFHSGNKTTVLPESGFSYLPSTTASPPTGIIVQDDGTDWVDADGTAHAGIQLQLPDTDVFKIDATATVPAEVDSFAGVGTILFNMAVDPSTGKLYVSNTEANNLVPTEPAVNGNLHRSRISVIDGIGTVAPRHLNKHIDYTMIPSPAGVKEASLATPTAMAISTDGKVYVTAFGSSSVGVFSASQLDADSFVPSASAQIAVSGGGPNGIVLDEANDRIYVLTRFDNSVSVIDRTSESEIAHLALHNPEPASIIAGRPFLYDARLTSSNGEASCSSCHVFGRMDDLAWDLGDEAGSIILNPNPFRFDVGLGKAFHPLKGPMTTQSLRGMANQGPMHWRGDRSGALVGGNAFDEEAAFAQFNPAFVGLMGRSSVLSNSEMQAFTDMILQLVYPPNPVRNLDNSLTAAEAAGSVLYHVPVTDIVNTCQDCHVLNPAAGFFGTDGMSSFENAPQDLKIPHLRNLYQKVGMFGAVPQDFFVAVQNIIPSHGPANQPQVRGFGLAHNGATDSLISFIDTNVFNFPGGAGARATSVRQVADFMIAFPSDLPPVVGQQVTLTAASAAAVSGRIDLFIQRAQVAYPSPTSPAQMECDLIVQGELNGSPRGWLYNTGSGLFQSDGPGEPQLADADLRNIATSGTGLTYTCAPPGSGHRMAIDRDLDQLMNFAEVLAGTNPADGDTDDDGVLDGLDNCKLIVNPAQRDSNADGFGNFCDGDFNNDGNTNSLDLGYFKTNFFSSDPDGDINGDGIVNSFDLGLFKDLFFLSPGP